MASGKRGYPSRYTLEVLRRCSGLLTTFLTFVLGAAGHPPGSAPASLPLFFEPNVGQAEASAQFLVRGPGYTLLVKGSETRMLLVNGEARAELITRLEGASPSAIIAGLDRLPGYSNHLLGASAAQWKKHVPHFGSVKVTAAYRGVDVVYYGRDRQLEYDFLVAPGADPDQIALAFDGARRLRLEAGGDLSLETAAGRVLLKKPFAYQEIAGKRVPVGAHYRLRGKTVRIALGRYDRSRPLVIDPAVAFSFARANGAGYAVAADSSGNSYIAGVTPGNGFAAAGPIQQSHGGGTLDAFVMKLNPQGNTVLFVTYFGGEGEDFARGIAIDSQRNMLVTGTTRSNQFPLLNPFQSSRGGGLDGFAAKIGADGSSLHWSTYLGGGGEDDARAIRVDVSGAAYIAGATTSVDFPVLLPFQTALSGGWDAFLVKLDGLTGTPLYSTYFGGGQDDFGRALAVDASGSAFLAGQSWSADLPVQGALQGVRNGNADAFVARFNPAGNGLVYSTYFGGPDVDDAGGIAADATGAAYLAGRGAGAPVTFPLMDGDSFLAKLGPFGNSLVYSTPLGFFRIPSGVAVDAGGASYVALTAPNPRSTAHAIKVDASGTQIVYDLALQPQMNASTPGDIAVHAVAVDPSGQAYFTGARMPGQEMWVVKVADPAVRFTFTTQPPGLQIIVDGKSYTSPQTLEFAPGSVHTIDAPTLQESNGTRQIFSGWQDGGPKPRTFTANADSTIHAVFLTFFRLTTATLPVNRGAVQVNPPAADGFYLSGITVSVTAIPNTNYQLSGWQGALTGNANPQLLLMDQPKSVTAQLAQTGACVYAVDRAAIAVPAAGETGIFNITAPPGCQWAVASSAGWLAGSPSSGFGSAAVNYTAAANTGAERTAVLTIVGETIPVTQLGAGVNSAPQPVSVSPASGTGLTQTFTFTYRDLNGANDILRVQALINNTLADAGCLLYYTVDSNNLSLRGGPSGWYGPVKLGQPGTLENSVCSVNAAASSSSLSGTTLNITLAVAFNTSFSGDKQVFAEALDKSNISSGYQLLGGWTVPAPGTLPPSVVDLTPSSGNGASQSFTARFSDGNGGGDIVRTRILVGSTAAGACLMEIRPPARELFLMNDAGTALAGPSIAGGGGTIENSQCIINVAGTILRVEGDMLTITVPITFKPSFAGPQTLWLEAVDTTNNSTGLRQAGTWNVLAGGNEAPRAISVNPSSGSGVAQTFTFTIRDPNGAADVQRVQMLFNFSLNASNACLVYLDRVTNHLLLLNDAGNAFLGPARIGLPGQLENSQCSMDASRSSATQAGTDLLVNVYLTFKPALAGMIESYAEALDTGSLSSSYIRLGSWMLPSVGAQAPQILSVAPSSGSGVSQTFRVIASDPNGAADLQRVQFNIVGGGRVCSIEYVRPGNQLVLRAGTELPPVDAAAVGAPRRLESVNCSVDAQTAAASSAGNTITLDLPIIFKNVFAGLKDLRALAVDTAGLSSGDRLVGSYTVVQGGNEAPSVVSVSPNAGGGLTQAFSFRFTDPNGAGDIQRAQMLINDSLAASGCLIYFTRSSSELLLLNDAATGWLGPLRVGTAATLQNRFCTVNGTASSAASAGNDLTVNANVTFASSFAGLKEIYGEVLDIAGLRDGYKLLGLYTVGGLPGHQPPVPVSVTPNSGIGLAFTYSFLFSDVNGATDIQRTQVRFARGQSNTNACLVHFNRARNELQLLNDAGTAWSPAIVLRTQNRVQNSQCIVDAAGSRAIVSGTNLTLDLTLRFLGAFEGTDSKEIFAEALDNAGLTSNYVSLGQWTVQRTSPANPMVAVSPDGGTGSNQQFRFTINNANGAADTQRAQIAFGRVLSASGSCLIYYDAINNSVALMNDAGAAFSPGLTIGLAGTVQNSQCTLNAGTSAVVLSGNTTTLDLALVFKPAFAGASTIFAEVLRGSGESTGYGTVGSWIVPF